MPSRVRSRSLVRPLRSEQTLYQALDPDRVGRDCVLKILRPGSAAAIYLQARPVEAAEG
jgi:hypothetical protein